LIRSGIVFLAGTLVSGSLFQFDLGLPSFHSKQLLAQGAKIDRVRDNIKKRRANLLKKSLKKTGKKVAGSLIPLVGTMATLGLAADDYCDELENIIELQNILEDGKVGFGFEECLREAKSFVESREN